MGFDDYIKATLVNLTNVDVQNDELIWEQIKLIQQFLPLDCQRRNQNDEISYAFQSFLKKVLNSNAMNEYGLSVQKTKCLDNVFLHALHVDSFFTLVTFLKDLKQSNKLNSVLAVLEKFFLDGSFEEMCKDQCCISSNDVKGRSAWKPIWEQMLTLIVSLPNRIHNKNIEQPCKTFELQSFSNIMARTMHSILEYVHDQLAKSRSMSLEFQSLLLGRLFISGYGEKIFQITVPRLIPLLDKYLWQKVVQKLILGVSDKHIESVITTLLSNVPWYGHLELFIGNGGIENNTIKYILTKKLVLIRFFDNPDVLFKCVGYYASNANGQTIVLTIFENLLDVWGKKSALKHQSESQHFYLSCGIMVCAAFLPSVEFASKKSVFMKYLLDGVQTHIENTSTPVRIQGMVIGQTVASILDPSGPKLSFEFEENENSKLLFSLLNVPKKLEVNENPDAEIKSTGNKERSGKNEQEKKKREEILDSDDDLEPYDQSNDTAFHKEKQPVYIQDIIDGLSDQSRINYSNLCLNSADKIIRAQPRYTVDVSEELAKILLHLEDTFAADNFVSARFRAMVALTVVSPQSVAKYFTQEFHNRNYNIRQRLDILEVLAAASQELSQSNLEKEAVRISKDVTISEATHKQAHWNDIIQKRIEAKTKRYGKKRKEMPEPVSNKFGSVAGTFYFPLMKDYDNPQNGLDLLGENSFVLGRLIYTLGIICNSAANTHIFRQIAKSMLDFTWTLRYHVDTFVRQALLFSLCMVISNSSHLILTQDLQAEVFECQLWLQDILEKDASKECQACAGKILTLLYQKLKEE